MAAILCKTFGDCCGGCCKILCSPFRLCCDATLSLCSNPFCLYVTTAVGFNVPPIAIGAAYLFQNFMMSCMGSMWLLVDLIFCILNIAAAFYMATRYRDPTSSGIGGGGTRRGGGFERAREILCYDPVIAIYIIVLVVFFIWLCVGVSWRFSGNLVSSTGEEQGMVMGSAGGSSDGCSEDVVSLVSTCIGLGFAFLGVGFIALFISVCCSCCCPCMDYDDKGEASDQHNNNNAHTSSHNQPAASTATTNGGSNKMTWFPFGSHGHASTYQRPSSNSYTSNHHHQNHDVENGKHNTSANTDTVIAPVTAIPVYDHGTSASSSIHPTPPQPAQQENQNVYHATVISTNNPNTTVEPSAPPLSSSSTTNHYNNNPSSMDDDDDDEAKAAASGVKFGGQIGKLFHANEKTKVKLETVGAKASVAANKGIQQIKKMTGISQS